MNIKISTLSVSLYRSTPILHYLFLWKLPNASYLTKGKKQVVFVQHYTLTFKSNPCNIAIKKYSVK